MQIKSLKTFIGLGWVDTAMHMLLINCCHVVYVSYFCEGYAGGWTGKYEEKFKIADCLDEPVYKKVE